VIIKEDDLLLNQCSTVADKNMTNEVLAVQTTGLLEVRFSTNLFSPLPWLGFVLVTVWLLVMISRWVIGRKTHRDPTHFVVACLILFGLFLLNATASMESFFGYIYLYVPDLGTLSLAVSQILQDILFAGVFCLISVWIACLFARRLPRIPFFTLTPLIIVVFDLAISFQWLIWLLTLKK
jgi:hypothetical protein